jgi:hypothetical protein
MVPARAPGLPLRPLVLILVAVVAVLVAGCGVQAGDDGSSGSTTSTAAADAPDDVTATDEAAIDRMREVYRNLGFTEEEADCLATAMSDLVDQGTMLEPDDTTALMDVLNECDISLSRMTELGGGTGGTGEDGFKAGIEASLRAQGLTPDQASCVADAYVERYGTDPTRGSDPEAVAPLLDDCGA